MDSDNTMYVCQKKSTDGGKTWGPLTFPFGRTVANREASPVYDEVHHKLIVVGNLMNQQLIMVPFLPFLSPRPHRMMRAIPTLPWRTSTRRWVPPTRPTSAWAMVSSCTTVLTLVVW